MKKMSPTPARRAAAPSTHAVNSCRAQTGGARRGELVDAIGCLLARRGLILVLLVLVSFFQLGVAQDQDKKGEQLATDIWKASGGEQWANVQDLRFSFVVEDESGKQIFKAEHDWDVLANTDDVKWKDKNGNDKHIKVNLASPGTDEDSKTAYARWVNDSYWLLAPLKIRDRGVHVKAEGVKEAEGANCETVRLSFDKIGLTPSDQYVLYIDPPTKLVRAWDYIPKPDTTIHGTWEKYQNFSGLFLSTQHHFKDKVIRLADIQVSMAK